MAAFSFQDPTGQSVQLNQQPKRIISLVPSLTELLYDLGAGSKVVGRTKFCIYPAQQVKHAAVCGGTKNFRLDTIEQLAPDLIIVNKEENYQEGVLALAARYPVLMTDIYTLEDNYKAILEIGQAIGHETEAAALVQQMKIGFQDWQHEMFATYQSPLRVAYFIWKEPYMAAGSQTFIHEMLLAAGFDNALGHLTRYPELETGDLLRLDADFLFLSSEPYPFQQKHLQELEELTGKTVVLVDGEMFSWYGSRLLHAPSYFQKLMKQLALC